MKTSLTKHVQLQEKAVSGSVSSFEPFLLLSVWCGRAIARSARVRRVLQHPRLAGGCAPGRGRFGTDGFRVFRGSSPLRGLG